MKYIRTEDGHIFPLQDKTMTEYLYQENGDFKSSKIIARADSIEKLCDCFIKIKRNKGCKDFILKFDHTDLTRLKEQKLKYPESPVYGAIHVENKGLIYVARMNDKGELELL